MKRIIIFALFVGAVYVYRPDLVTGLWSSGAYDEAGNPVTMVFTHNNCGRPCSDVVNILDKRDIDYRLYNIEDSDEGMSLWKRYSKVNSFPVIISGDREANGSYKARLVSMLAAVNGDRVLNRVEKSIMRNHFHTDGRRRIVMYGASWCPGCKTLRQQFRSNNIEFEEIDVEAVANGQILISTLDIAGYPLTYVGYERVEGLNYSRIVSYLD